MARNKYPEETRNLIIETAARLFIEQGYEHTSIQDIINHLGGLSKGAIYHHFKSKEDIMSAVAEWIYAGTEARMYEICRRTDLNGKERLKALFRDSLTNPAQQDMFTTSINMLDNPKLLAIYLQDIVQGEATLMVQNILEEGIQDGSIKIEYPKEIAEVVMSLGNIWLNPMIYKCDPEGAVRKMKVYQELMRLLGLDIVDDTMIKTLEEYTQIYQKKQTCD